MFGIPDFHATIRNKICDFIEEHDHEMPMFFKPGGGKPYVIQHKMRSTAGKLSSWASDPEVLATAMLSGHNVMTFGRNGWLIHYANRQFVPSEEAIYLDNLLNDHYNVVLGM